MAESPTVPVAKQDLEKEDIYNVQTQEEPQPIYEGDSIVQQEHLDDQTDQKEILQKTESKHEYLLESGDLLESGSSYERLLSHFASQILQHQSTHQEQTRNLFKIKNRRRIPDISTRRKQLIDEIWSDVKPFHMGRIHVVEADQTVPGTLHKKCTQLDDLKVLFTPDGSDAPPPIASAHLAILRSKVEHLEASHEMSPPWAGFGVMAACAELARGTGLQVGQVLTHCYMHGSLEQPMDNAPENYLEQVLLVIQVSLLMNDTLHFDAPGSSGNECIPSVKWCSEILTRRRNLDEVLGINIHSLLQVYHATHHAPSTLSRAPGLNFAVDDLNVKALRSIGQLSIVWTTTFEDHLLLDTQRRILYVSYFHKPFSWLGVPMDFWQRMINSNNLPKTFVDYPANRSEEALKFPSEEILLSWAILFATSPIARTRNADIAKLGSPTEIHSANLSGSKPLSSSNFSFSRLRARHNIYSPASSLCPHQGAVDTDPVSNTPFVHTGYRVMTDAALNHETVSYSKFPIYESRLRELRYYMDAQQQKPKGLKQVWQASKGTLSWYLFWLFLLIGAIGIFLGVCGVALGVAQVVAGYKVLGFVNGGD